MTFVKFPFLFFLPLYNDIKLNTLQDGYEYRIPIHIASSYTAVYYYLKPLYTPFSPDEDIDITFLSYLFHCLDFLLRAERCAHYGCAFESTSLFM